MLAVLISIPVTAQDRQLMLRHSISIEVECLDAAMEVIRELNGYNLEASVYLHEAPNVRGAERSASIARRVDHWAFAHIQEALRDMGEVRHETENAQFLGAQIIDLDARLVALTEEIERLAIMMAGSDNLDMLIAIDARLSQVVLERNSVIGTRNVLISHVASPVINITLTETTGERPTPTQPGFGNRVVDSFTGSLRTTGVVAGNLLVFVARTLIPFLIYGLIMLLIVWICVKIKRKRDKRPVLAMVSAGVALGNATNVEAKESPLPDIDTGKDESKPDSTSKDDKEGEQ